MKKKGLIDISKQGIWKDRYRIHSYEVGTDGIVRLSSLCNYLQESAWNHATDLKVGYQDLLKNGNIWVLSRLYIKIKEYPRWGDEILVKTWPKGIERLFALRDFEILNTMGDCIGSATTKWLIVNRKSKRPQKPDPYFQDIPLLMSKHAVDTNLEKLPPVKEEDQSYSLSIRYSDLDVQNHVNNTKYIEWVLDGYSLEKHKSHLIHTYEINYLSETVYGEELLIRYQRSSGAEGVFFINGVNKNDNREIFRARLELVEREVHRLSRVEESEAL